VAVVAVVAAASIFGISPDLHLLLLSSSIVEEFPTGIFREFPARIFEEFSSRILESFPSRFFRASPSIEELLQTLKVLQTLLLLVRLLTWRPQLLLTFSSAASRRWNARAVAFL